MDDVTRRASGSASSRTHDGGRKAADELPPTFASVEQEINFYARFLQPLVTALPSERDRATAAQWSLLLTAGAARAGVHDEYLRQLLVCCALGRLLGVFARPPASAALRPLPEEHTVAWLTRTAHALGERERSAGQPGAEAQRAPPEQEHADGGGSEAEGDADKRSGQQPGDAADQLADADRQPVRQEVSAAGTQYLAVQEGKGTGDDCHFYLAFSEEPVSLWVGATDTPDPPPPRIVVPEEEPSGDPGRSGSRGSGPRSGSGSIPWLSSHEGEGLDWLISNPGFLTLPSAEKPDSALWQEASSEHRDDAFSDFGPGTTVDDADLPTQTVWVEDEWGGLTEADAVVLGPGGGGSPQQQWRPAEQVIAELGAFGLGGGPLDDAWSEPVAASNPFSPAAQHFSFSPDFGGHGPQDFSAVFGDAESEDDGVPLTFDGVSPAFESPVAPAGDRSTRSAAASTPRSQVRLLIGTPSREAVVVPGESSPRNLRSAVSSRPQSPAESSPPFAMRRARAPSWDGSYTGSSFGHAPQPQRPPAHSFQSSASSASSPGWPQWPQQAVRVAPVAAIALPFPAGPFGGGAWGGQSYDDGTSDSYGYASMGRRGRSPGAWHSSQGHDSLGQTYGSTDASEQATGASSLGGGGWPYAYSLSRSRSAPSTMSEGESALNEAMSGSSGYSPSEPSLRYDSEYGPAPPRTPRASRRRRPQVEEDPDGSLFKPTTTGRRTIQPQIHRAFSDSNLRQPQFDTMSSRWESPASSWGTWTSPGGARCSTPQRPMSWASTPARSRVGRPGAGARRTLHFSDDSDSYEEPPTSAGVSGYAPSAPWSTPSSPGSPRYNLPLVRRPPGPYSSPYSSAGPFSTPRARPRARQHQPLQYSPQGGMHTPQGVMLAVPAGAVHVPPYTPQRRRAPRHAPARPIASTPARDDYFTSPMVPVRARAGRMQPTRLENRFGSGTGAVISAMVYPDATVASATYQSQMSPGRTPPLRHGWFRVSETGRPQWRAPLDASLASSPPRRAGPNPRVRPVPRAGIATRRLSFSDNSSDWSPNSTRQAEPQVEFPPSSPSSTYDTSYHTAPSSPYSDYHSFN